VRIRLAKTGVFFHSGLAATKTHRPYDSRAVLECIISQWSPPYIMTSDNGGRFIGAEFGKRTKGFNIRQWKIKPCTPQQNGKIECFWETLDSARGGGFNSCLTYFIVQQYLEVSTHQTLGCTPLQAWQGLLHWTHKRAPIQPGICQNLIWETACSFADE
jgi:transposase InsO family protein